MWDELALAIIAPACEDYIYKKEHRHPTNHIERFFTGEWCAFLLSASEIDGRTILRYLKNR